MNNGRKELRVFVNGEQVTRWIFLERLRLCFRFKANNGGEWENIEYEQGFEICKRIIMNTGNNGVKVEGSLVEELQRESMITKLLSEGRVVIGGVQ